MQFLFMFCHVYKVICQIVLFCMLCLVFRSFFWVWSLVLILSNGNKSRPEARWDRTKCQMPNLPFNYILTWLCAWLHLTIINPSRIKIVRSLCYNHKYPDPKKNYKRRQSVIVFYGTLLDCIVRYDIVSYCIIWYCIVMGCRV